MALSAHMGFPLPPVFILIWMCGTHALTDVQVLCNWLPTPGLDWDAKCLAEDSACTFEGVTCVESEITEIDISGRDTLSGTLYEEITQLNSLQRL